MKKLLMVVVFCFIMVTCAEADNRLFYSESIPEMWERQLNVAMLHSTTPTVAEYFQNNIIDKCDVFSRAIRIHSSKKGDAVFEVQHMWWINKFGREHITSGEYRGFFREAGWVIDPQEKIENIYMVIFRVDSNHEMMAFLYN